MGAKAQETKDRSEIELINRHPSGLRRGLTLQPHRSETFRLSTDPSWGDSIPRIES